MEQAAVTDELGGLRLQASHLLDLVSQDVEHVDLTEVRQGLHALLSALDDLLRRQRAFLGEPSAVVAFERLVRLDPAFTALSDAWARVRTEAGLAAAREMLARSDIYGGYRRRWGDLAEIAWQRRTELEQEVGTLAPRRVQLGAGGDSQSDGRTRESRVRAPAPDPVLLADLRYGADLPLAQIGEYVGLSPAAVQFRIAEFEEGVFARVARDVVERQMPEGWRLESAVEGRRGEPTRFVLRRSGSERAGPRILIEVVPVWAEREGSVGRPRSTQRSGAVPHAREVLIWAVVFPEGPRIVFVPQIRLDEGRGAMSQARIIEAAVDDGFTVLSDAVRVAGSGA